MVGVKKNRSPSSISGQRKRNALVKETFPLLKEGMQGHKPSEALRRGEIPHGDADVIVCEAFVGNVIPEALQKE